MYQKIILGISSGFISGLFGAGGGMILVPFFVYFLKLNQKESRATTIFCILPMVIVSGLIYSNNDLINWDIAVKCAIGGVIGGVIGSKLLVKLSNKVLRIMFVCFLVYVSIQYIF